MKDLYFLDGTVRTIFGLVELKGRAHKWTF